MMSKAMTVRELRDQLVNMSVYDLDLPVFLYDLNTCETFPLERVDPTISDRIDLNFLSEQESEDA